MSVAQRFTLSLLMSFWLPPVVSMRSLATYRELTNAPMSSPLSLPHTLCLSPSRNSPPPSLILSFSLLFSFLPDYISGDFDSITAEVRAFFAAKVSGTRFAHTLLQVQTQKCIEIKAKGLQMNIIKFELSSGGRLAAPLILSSLVRCPAGLQGAGTCMISYS